MNESSSTTVIDPLDDAEQRVNRTKTSIENARNAIREFAAQNGLPLEAVLLGEHRLTVQFSNRPPDRDPAWPLRARALRARLYQSEQEFYAALRVYAGLKG